MSWSEKVGDEKKLAMRYTLSILFPRNLRKSQKAKEWEGVPCRVYRAMSDGGNDKS